MKALLQPLTHCIEWNNKCCICKSDLSSLVSEIYEKVIANIHHMDIEKTYRKCVCFSLIQ